MLPQLNSAFRNWFSSVQLRIVKVIPSDFEAKTDMVDSAVINMMITVMSPKKVERKPENLRNWKWWEGNSEVKLSRSTVLQDPNGTEFMVDSVEDWSQAGFYKYDLVEQPKGLVVPPEEPDEF